MDNENTDLRLASLSEWAARGCAVAVIALGALVLFGWALDIAALKSMLPGLATMKANTAVGFLLAGGSLLAAGAKNGSPGRHHTRVGLAAMLALLGLLTLGEYAFAVNLGVDQLLFSDPADSVHLAPPGRMALATAMAFVLTGLALLVLDGRRGRLGSQAAALAGSVIGILAVLGYTYDVAALYRVGAYSSVGLHTAIGIVVVNLGILLARPRRGLMVVVTSRTLGGVLARRLLPFALLAPFVIGWFRIQGEQLGYYTSGFGAAVMTMLYVAVFGIVIWRTADMVGHSDQHRLGADRKLREQEAKVTGIIDSAIDAIVMINDDQHIVLFNPAAVRMFGWPAEDVLGKPVEMLLPQRFRRAHPAQVRTWGNDSVTRSHVAGLRTLTGLRANGDEFPVEASISRLETNGDKYYTVILRDITESRRVQEALRESEAHLKLAIDVAKIGTWERNLETGAGVWSARTKEILGLDVNAYAFEDFVQRIYPEDLPRVRGVLTSALDSTPFEHEYRIVRPSGEVRWVNERGQAICDAHGRPVCMLGVALDITERRAVEDELQAAKARAERADNAKSRFLAAASHDLRQPLAGLRLYADVLRDKVAPGQQALVASMDDCINSLSGLLTDLLDLSKLQAGVVKPTVADFSVFEFLANLESVYTLKAQAKGLRLSVQPTRLTGRSDSTLFHRIVGNFIENAIRYAEHGGIVVGCRRRLGKTWVEVWDTGIGIAADQTSAIFEEFKQLGDEARNQGSGLGLAIAARTAALLGLEINVRSRPGRGSVFAIELPRGRPEAITPPVLHAASYGPLRIGLVEDNALVRDALAVALREAGHQVIAAANGGALLAELGDSPPDIVVSDYRLTHGETGYDVITAVRKAAGTELPAIVITGDTDPKLIARMADRGIAVLHKPLAMNELKARLEDLTEQPS